MPDHRFNTSPSVPRPGDALVNDALHAIAVELSSLPPGRGHSVEDLVRELTKKGKGEPAVRWAVHEACERGLLSLGWAHRSGLGSSPTGARTPTRQQGQSVTATEPLWDWEKDYQQQMAAMASWAALVPRPSNTTPSLPSSAKPGVKKPAPRSGRDKKLEQRNEWIYRRCLKGRAMPYDKIVSALLKIAPERGWSPVRSKQRIQQIGKEYAEKHGLPLPPPRQNL
jgi:hypothetical protein